MKTSAIQLEYQPTSPIRSVLAYIERKAEGIINYSKVREEIEAAKKAGLISVRPKPTVTRINKGGRPKSTEQRRAKTEIYAKQARELVRKLDMFPNAIAMEINMDRNSVYNTIYNHASLTMQQKVIAKMQDLLKQKGKA